MPPPKKSCKLFLKGKCTFGNKCRFSHDIDLSRKPGPTRAPKVDNMDLRHWKTRLRFSGGFGVDDRTVSETLTQAKGLLDSGSTEVQHEVVTVLGDEHGLSLIKAAAEMPANNLSNFLLPFLQVLCHPDVISSLVLERHVGTIYNVLSGINATRGKRLFDQIVLVIQDLNRGPNTSEKIHQHIALALETFARMLGLNQSAAISEDMKDLARQLEQCFDDVSQSAQSESVFLLHATRSLREVQTRLGFARKIPEAANQVATITGRLAEFHIARDLPGNLCEAGQRHSNDFKEIKDVKILPTADEIWSDRSEYLPSKDFRKHHLPGVRGLLDRQFRLLREDTVGQLRDAVKQFGKKSADTQKQNQKLRTNLFENASVTASFFDKRHGLLHLVDFDQPRGFQKPTKSERKRAWQDCRDLALDACVCMVDADNEVKFYAVVDRDPSPSEGDEGFRQYTLDKTVLGARNKNLYDNNLRAAVILRLLNHTEKSIADVVGQQNRRTSASARHKLIEFPGILLASFMPTLEALQQMSQTADLPFGGLLAPDPGVPVAEIKGQLPHYASRTNFAFAIPQIGQQTATHFSPQQSFDLTTFSEASGLDRSQAQAFIHALSNQFALIQGPPGTGKSFVGVQLIRTLLANRQSARMGPIICVCYTNHALDQILEHLIDNGVKQIIRIGGRSKSEALAGANMKRITAQMERTKHQKKMMWDAHQEIELIVKDATRELAKISNADTIATIRDHLLNHFPAVHDSLFGQGLDNEGFEEVRDKPEKSFRRWLAGGVQNAGAPVRAQVRASQLNSLSHDERQVLYKHWVQEIRKDALKALAQHIEDFNIQRRNIELCLDETSIQCLRNAHIIGVTTTGLAKNIQILRKIRSKVLVVEEAGEVMEAHMLPALLPSLEHVIAIGDHQQLRPTIANYDLSCENPRGSQYSLDVSLFERLIHPEPGLPSLPKSTLQTQRRMHPLISRLIRNTIYRDLIDDQRVAEYPEIPSMQHRLFWYDHQEFENAEEISKSNDFEVEMTAALVTHLIKQGTYQTSQVTVLTPYLSQLRKLRRRFARVYEIVVGEKDKDQLVAAGLDEANPDDATSKNASRASLGAGLRISTVDNYQGEESDIIVVSLVRSNQVGKVGFLRTENRINVLLSRARHGMYIIGNATVASGIKMWKDVVDMLQIDGAIGPVIPLYCPRHPETPIEISKPDDFSVFAPEGGCNLTCNKRLTCGHSCINKCHAEHLHEAVICQSPCPRLKRTCSHPCPKACGLRCDEKCQALVENVTLLCGHTARKLRCFEEQAPETVKCTQKIEKQVPGCRHKVEVPCFKDVTADTYRCMTLCGSSLPCGHACGRFCSECNTIDEQGQRHTRHLKCNRRCDRNHTTCSHSCQKVCHGVDPCAPCDQPCQVECAHSKCGKTCSEPCVPCAESCAWHCEHQGSCALPCSVPCSRLPCSERCFKLLECGHQCPSICGEPCPKRRFCHQCGDDQILDFVVDYIMFSTYRDINLDEDVVIVPPCGHLQTLSSLDGQMDIKRFYELDEQEQIIGLSGWLHPFEQQDIKTCPTCRGSFRTINRYNRIVKRGLIDEATKRFIIWANSNFLKFEQQGYSLQTLLSDSRDQARFQTELGTKFDSSLIADPSAMDICGPSVTLIRIVRTLKETRGRYKAIWTHRTALSKFCQSVALEEQPFQKVWDLCRSVARDGSSCQDLESFEDAADSALNTRSYLLTRSLLLQTDVCIFTDFVEVWTRSRTIVPTLRALSIDSSHARRECMDLFDLARAKEQPGHEVEALILFAFFAAAEIRCPHDLELVEELRQQAIMRLEEASQIVDLKPSTRQLAAKIQAARVALTGTFQSIVTDDEMRAVYAAMATEFSGTGHWYRCENGHPFTIGECGMPMQRARCPQCNAPIGGEHHTAVRGVQTANDIERQFS